MRATLITWTSATGAPAQAATQPLPWTQEVIGPTNQSYSLTAKNGDSGAVRCEIDINGKVLTSNTGSGPYQTASCQVPAQG